MAPSIQLTAVLLLASSALLCADVLRMRPGRPDVLVALMTGGLLGVAWLSIPTLSASAAW